MDMSSKSQMTSPSDDEMDQGADSQAQGYVIEITVTADGQISVGVESSSEEAQEESGEGAAAAPAEGADPAEGAEGAEGAEPAEGAAMPAKNIKEALTMALEIFKNNGQAPAADTSDSDFSSGYSGQ